MEKTTRMVYLSVDGLTVDWKEWDVGSEDEDSDGSGGWIEVSSDEEHGIDISDSEDEEPKPPPPKVDGEHFYSRNFEGITPAYSS